MLSHKHPVLLFNPQLLDFVFISVTHGSLPVLAEGNVQLRHPEAEAFPHERQDGATSLQSWPAPVCNSEAPHPACSHSFGDLCPSLWFKKREDPVMSRFWGPCWREPDQGAASTWPQGLVLHSQAHSWGGGGGGVDGNHSAVPQSGKLRDHTVHMRGPPRLCWGQSWLPLHPAGRGGMSFRGFAEFWGSGSSAPTDAPEATPAGLEGAKGTAESQWKCRSAYKELDTDTQDEDASPGRPEAREGWRRTPPALRTDLVPSGQSKTVLTFFLRCVCFKVYNVMI